MARDPAPVLSASLAPSRDAARSHGLGRFLSLTPPGDSRSLRPLGGGRRGASRRGGLGRGGPVTEFGCRVRIAARRGGLGRGKPAMEFGFRRWAAARWWTLGGLNFAARRGTLRRLKSAAPAG